MTELSQVEPFEIKGQWWRPEGAELVRALEGPERESYGLDEGVAILQGPRDRLEGSELQHACRGPLRFDPDSKPELRLSLLGSSVAVFGSGGSGYAVHGLTADGVPCSLLDCFAFRSKTQLFGGFAEHEVLGNTFVHGAHVSSLGDLVSDRLTIKIPALAEFLVAGRGLGSDGPEDHEVVLDGAKVKFKMAHWTSNDTLVRSRHLAAIVEITLADAIAFEDWVPLWIEPLARLTVFTTGQPAVPSSVSMMVDDADAEAKSRRVQVIQPQRRLADTGELRLDRMLVSYSFFGSDFDEFVARWWDLHHRLAGAGDFLFGVLRDPTSLEPQLITLTSVIEGYHRAFHDEPAIPAKEHNKIVERMLATIEDEEIARHYEVRLLHADETSQRQRLLQVIRRAGGVVEPLGRKTGQLADAINTTRNYFVHLAEKDDQILEGMSLYEVNQILILALRCNLLLDLGQPPAKVLASVERLYAGQPFWREMHHRDCAWPKPPRRGKTM